MSFSQVVWVLVVESTSVLVSVLLLGISSAVLTGSVEVCASLVVLTSSVGADVSLVSKG